MDGEGANRRRLSYEGRYNESAAWSPRGDRIAYVIDMSDSMLTPLTGKEKADLRGPITGPGAGDRRDGDGAAGGKSGRPLLDALPKRCAKLASSRTRKQKGPTDDGF